jgi:hypothetical protein
MKGDFTMLQNIDKQELAKALYDNHECAQHIQVTQNMAERIIKSTHPLLEHVIQAYINGIDVYDDNFDFEFKEYSIQKIRKIRNECGFFTAVRLLSEYIDDQEKGEKEIYKLPPNVCNAPLGPDFIDRELLHNFFKRKRDD